MDKIYKDAKTGLVGINKLSKRLNKPISEVKKELDDVDLYQLHKSVKNNPQRVFYDKPFESYQIDLIDMSKYGNKNKNFKWIFTMIDCFSRKAFAKAIKNKSNTEVLKCIQDIITENKLKPHIIQSDNGNEFINKNFEDYMTKLNITHNVTQPYSPQSNGMIERFNRTLKSMLFKYFTLTDNFVWIDVLDDLMINYNSSYHSSIGLAPDNVSNKNIEEVDEFYHDKCFNKNIHNLDKFDINDKVRILLNKKNLEKKFTESFSEEIFIIKAIGFGDPGYSYDSYSLEDSKGKRLPKKYLYHQLIKVGDDSSKIKKVERKKEEKINKAAKKLQIEFKTSLDTQKQSIKQVNDNQIPVLPKRLIPKDVKRVVKKPSKYGD